MKREEDGVGRSKLRIGNRKAEAEDRNGRGNKND